MQPDESEREPRNNVIEFLRTELSVAMIYTTLADRQRRSGCEEEAKHSVADAEKGYSALRQFLADPACAKVMNAAEKAHFDGMLGRLRKTLDSFSTGLTTK